MSKTGKKVAFVAIAVLVVALWYAFRPDKLFINKEVDEPEPSATLQ